MARWGGQRLSSLSEGGKVFCTVLFLLAGCDGAGLAERVSQSYRDTSLFITRGFASPASLVLEADTDIAWMDEKPGRAFRLAAEAGHPARPACQPERMPKAAGERRRAAALGRRAQCLERSGEHEAAIALRQEQESLHRQFGSILYPAAYYQGAPADRSLRVVGAEDLATDCVSAVAGDSDTLLCPTCRRPVALTNACGLTVQLAYCVQQPPVERPVQTCAQYRTLGPGDTLVILTDPGTVVSPILSFRSVAERDLWVREAGQN